MFEQGATIKKNEKNGAVTIARIMKGGAADRSGELYLLVLIPPTNQLFFCFLFFSPGGKWLDTCILCTTELWVFTDWFFIYSSLFFIPSV